MGYYVTNFITVEQYKEIIDTIRKGFLNTRPNNQVATALILEGNLGIRIGDVMKLKLNNFIKHQSSYRINIIEQKGNKKRDVVIGKYLYDYIVKYCINNNIKEDEFIFNISKRQVERILKKAVDYLGYKNISTHSFRKFYATNIFNNFDYNINIVQKLLQHESPDTTQVYIKSDIDEDRLNEIVKNNLDLI